MKAKDFFFIAFWLLVFLPFLISEPVYEAYANLNKDHGLLAGFVKFAVLATLGEVIALRIRKGTYRQEGFGILPRAVIWGFLGMTVFLAFKIFSTGTPVFLTSMGYSDAVKVMEGPFSYGKIPVAFAISVAMNLIYAPVLMTVHKITDEHIVAHGGTLRGLLKPIDMAGILKSINWDIQWHFVFKKTIPFFWIPAHTVTFLLPSDFQVLFAALLSVALGVFLAVASLKNR